MVQNPDSIVPPKQINVVTSCLVQIYSNPDFGIHGTAANHSALNDQKAFHRTSEVSKEKSGSFCPLEEL